MKIRLTNPWRCTNPLYPVGTQTCDAASRLEMVKITSDPLWLNAVTLWPETQKTVRQAAERRLRWVNKALLLAQLKSQAEEVA